MVVKASAEPFAVGDRLPALALPSAAGGTVPLRVPGRMAPVVVVAHGAVCEECRAYLAALAAVEDGVREWDGRVVAVVPGTPEEAGRLGEELALPFAVVADPAGDGARRLGAGGAAVLIADQWGELHHVQTDSAGHDLPSADEVVDWLRYLAIQCPECQGEAL